MPNTQDDQVQGKMWLIGHASTGDSGGHPVLVRVSQDEPRGPFLAPVGAQWTSSEPGFGGWANLILAQYSQSKIPEFLEISKTLLGGP